MAEQPDFEKMTPDEIMAWMETLAKRQGATEGFTTAADLDIPEVDPDTAVIDEPGYIPYSEARAGHPLDETLEGPAAFAVPPPATTSAPPAPAPAQPSAPPPAAQPPARPEPPAWSVPPRAPEPTPPAPAPEAQGSLAWLESLAQQNEDTLFNLDLSGLGEEPEEAAATDPARWLETIAATPELQRIAGIEPEPDEDTGSLLWLESLARRQGAPTDELTTPANLKLDELPEEPEAPAYTPFSFDTSPTPRSATPARAADPASFLGSLAASEGYSEAGVLATREPAEAEPAAMAGDGDDIEEIKRAISEGRVTSDQIHTLFEHQADIAATLPPGADELDLDADEPLVPADVPDWLLEQVEVEPEPSPRTDVPPLESLFEQPIEQAIPDWLKDEADDDGFDLQDIFAEVEAPAAGAAPAAVEVDPTDPWVEALDLEHSQGLASVEAPPEWYLQNVSDPQRVAAVEGTALSAEALPPETELPVGLPQPVPDWIAAEAPAPVVPEDEGVPEWLLEMENVVTSSEIPAWLNEPVDIAASDELPFELEEAPPTPEFVIDVPTPPSEPEPAAEPIAAAAPVAPAGGPSLASARERRQSGDVAAALTEYEALIRAGDSLQDCVDDLAHVARLDRDNPVVYRVLGDGYMRLGKLQLALDTYRQALNHL